MAIYEGGCHCGRIAFAVEGEIDRLYECNCSICSKRGALHWFVPAAQVTLESREDAAETYLFNKHAIRHRFCPTCGIGPYSVGEKPGQGPMYAVNARCLEAVDLTEIPVTKVDGRSF